MVLEKQSFSVRLALLIGAAVVAMMALSAILIVESRYRINDFHVENAKTALAVSLSFLEEKEDQHHGDATSLEALKERALSKLREFRYQDGEGYIAVLDDTGLVVMHPVFHHLENTNIWNFQDPAGTFITREAITAAKTQKSFVKRYLMEHPFTGEVELKTSVVGRFDPWDWTLIVGVYPRSVNDAVNDMYVQAAWAVSIMSALFLVLALMIGRSLSRPIAALTGVMTAIAEGKLDTPIPYQNLKNETGRMSRALAVFRNSGLRILELQAERAELQRFAEAQRLQMTTDLRDQFGEVLEAASNGRFCSRVKTDLTDDNLRSLAKTLNAFVGKVEAGVSAVRQGMSSMSRGEQPTVRAEAFEGAFADMLQHVSNTAERIRRQAEGLRYTAYHDALTELPNRRYFEKRLAEIESAKEQNERVALLHIDLDSFKKINDTLGHSAGDDILRFTARSLEEIAGGQDFVARIGGDEFIVLCSEDTSGDAVDAIANSIVEKFSQPYETAAGTAHFGASVGVAFGGEELGYLFRNADLALYDAKRQGRNRVAYFTERLRFEFVETRRKGDDIFRGLENGEFIPYFQPQFDAKTCEIVGVEALARWRKADGCVLTPYHFQAIAEELNVLSKIDDQISRAAVKIIDQINKNCPRRIDRLSLNLSLKRLIDKEFMCSLAGLTSADVRVSFELLESIVFDDQGDEFAMHIDALRECGFEIEIDDFGSGRASITGLLKVSPDRLKIDQKLIAPTIKHPPTRRLVETILEMGRILKIDVVAEGVETPEHVHLLREMQCQTLQGYALAKPMSEQGLMDLLSRDDLVALNH